jgi:hypothetical protein
MDDRDAHASAYSLGTIGIEPSRLFTTVTSRLCYPLLRGIDLPMHGAYHPLGYRGEVTINSLDVLEAAGKAAAVMGRSSTVSR